jgi:hypothetical protein
MSDVGVKHRFKVQGARYRGENGRRSWKGQVSDVGVKHRFKVQGARYRGENGRRSLTSCLPAS